MIDQDAQGKTKCSSTTHLVAVASTSRRRSSRSSLMEMDRSPAIPVSGTTVTASQAKPFSSLPAHTSQGPTSSCDSDSCLGPPNKASCTL